MLSPIEVGKFIRLHNLCIQLLNDVDFWNIHSTVAAVLCL